MTLRVVVSAPDGDTLDCAADHVVVPAVDGEMAIYPGHEEGDAEGRMIEEYLSTLPRWKICATKVKLVNSPTSPYFFMIESK